MMTVQEIVYDILYDISFLIHNIRLSGEDGLYYVYTLYPILR